MITGLIICCLLACSDQSKSLGNSLDSFLRRMLLGGLIGANYFAAVIIRFSSEISALHVIGFGAIGLLVKCNRNCFELIAAASSFLFAMATLALSQRISVASRARSSRDVIFDKETVQPLSFIVGAKLLSILCCHLPFAYAAAACFHQGAGEGAGGRRSFDRLAFIFWARLLIGIISIFGKSRTSLNYVKHFSAAAWPALAVSGLITLLQQHGNALIAINQLGAVSERSKVISLTVVYIGMSLCTDAIELGCAFDPGDGHSDGLHSIVMASSTEHLINVIAFAIYRCEVVHPLPLLHFTSAVVSVILMKMFSSGAIRWISHRIEHLMKLQMI